MAQAAPDPGIDLDVLMLENNQDAPMAEAAVHPGEDLDHVAAVLSDQEGRLQGLVHSKQPRRKKGPSRQAAGRPGAASGRGREGRSQAGTGDVHGERPALRRRKAGRAAGAAGPSAGSTSDSAHDKPGPQSTRKAWFCEACDCWVPSAGMSGRDQLWQAHVAGSRHRRQAAAAAARATAASPLDAAPNQEATSYYRSRVLPAMKHAAEELRAQREGASAGGGVPSLRQAARSADAVLRAEGDVAGRVESLHAAAMKELLHHCGASGEFHRLASRLSRERLACAWPYLAQKAAAVAAAAAPVVAARSLAPQYWDILAGSLQWGAPADGPTLMLLSATPATIACLAAMLPDLAVHTVLVSVGSQHALDLAAATAALCLLARAVRNAPGLGRLQLSLLAAKPDTGTAEQVADRHAQLVGQVLRALKGSLAANCTLRLLSVRVLEPGKVGRDWADLQAAAAQAPVNLRTAALCALHPREAGKSPLAWLPQPLLKDVLDAALPLKPCRVKLQ